MMKIEFSSVQRALDHAERFGGWIFDGETTITWYDAQSYTMTQILLDSPGNGMVFPWRELANTLRTC